MRFVVMALLLVAAASISQAQPSAAAEPGPGVSVIKYSWSKERIGWEQDPFGGPIENFDEMRARARNEKRIDDAKRGGGADVDRIRREANTDAAIVQKLHQQTPSRYYFQYKVAFRNDGAKTIKAIDWDYVFFDGETHNELGRHQFTSERKILSGKNVEITFMIGTPPTRTISVNALNKKERVGLGESVEIVGIEYADGSSWRRP